MDLDMGGRGRGEGLSLWEGRCDCVKRVRVEEIYESIGKWFFMWEITRCGGH